jgi:acetyltransferase-like isoleucine patch superfamily enzyme
MVEQGAVQTVELGAADPAAVALAETQLRGTPGLGAVVVLAADGEPTAVVTYALLAERVPGEPWLPGLHRVLTARSYAVLDQHARPWQPRAAVRRFGPLRTLARKTLNVGRVPPRQRAASGRRRWRRQAFLARLRWEAWLAGTDLELRVAKDLYVEPGVRFQLAPGRALLEVGPRCRLLGGTVLRLRGELVVGAGCEIRHDVTINVKGRLELRGRNVIGKGVMLHADAPMVWEWGACIAEYGTVLDTHHTFDGSLVHMFDQGVDALPIHIGASSFIGSKATVMPGVVVGRGCVVGAGSVVTKDVPDGCVVAGLPAKPLRQLGGGR